MHETPRYMGPDELSVWDSIIPKVVIDEEAFREKRKRWRVGHHEPPVEDTWCPHLGEKTSVEVADIGGIIEDGPTAIRLLVHHLAVAGVQLGAGTEHCWENLNRVTDSIK